jgi:hypothetical protein
MKKPVGVSGKPKLSAAGAANRWEQRETIAKILSLIAIPIVLAIVGWLVQSSLSDRSASQEYVKLSVSILKEPTSTASASPPSISGLESRPHVVDRLGDVIELHFLTGRPFQHDARRPCV